MNAVSAGALQDLAARINREHQAAEKCAASAVDHARACGSLLLEAKRQVARGEWLPWLEANVTVTVRMAQNYMRLSAELAKMSHENAKRVAHLPIRDALRSIAGDAALLARVEPEQREKVYAAVECGANAFHAIANAKEQVRKEILQRQAPKPAVLTTISTARTISLTRCKDPTKWMVEIGPNAVGARFDALSWFNMARDVRDSDDAVAALRSKHNAAKEAAEKLCQALKEAQTLVDDLGRELYLASYKVLEARYGRAEWNVFATRHVPPAISTALGRLVELGSEEEARLACLALYQLDAEVLAEILSETSLISGEASDFQISSHGDGVNCDVHYQCYKSTGALEST